MANLEKDKGRFRFRKMVNGKRYTIYLMTENKKVALKHFDKILALFKALTPEEAYQRALTLYASEKTIQEKYSILNLLQKFIEYKAINLRSTKNHITLKTNISAFLKNQLNIKDLLLTDTTSKFVNDYISYLSTKPIRQKPSSHKIQRYGMKQSSIRKDLILLKSAFNFAIENLEWLETNPAKNITVKKDKEHLLVHLEKEEVQKLFDATKRYYDFYPNRKNISEFLLDVFMTLIYTGMRIGELRNLDWGSVNISNRTIFLGAKEFVLNDKIISWQPKATYGSIPISKKIIHIFERRKLMSSSALVFDDPFNGGLMRIELNKYLKEMCHHAGITKNMSVHKLRHTTGTLLRLEGARLESIMKILRHSRIEETLIYAHVGANECVDTIDLI